MRKAITLLLAAIMILGTLGSVLLFLIPREPTMTDPFADIPDPVISSFKYTDFSGLDVSSLDLSQVGDDYLTYGFDSNTKWPPADKMPQGFSPEDVMSEGKYLGLGLKALRDAGITGNGVPVAVIDKPLLQDHEAYSANLEYIEVKPGDAKMSQTHFHGAACATILAGSYGVAPEAPLYYFAVPDDAEPYVRYTEAMNLLLEMQEELPSGHKIRVVSVSHGIDPAESGALAWAEVLEKAEEQGIIVVYPGMPGLNFTGAGCLPGLDRDDPENYRNWSWTLAKEQIVGKLEASGANSFESARAELKRILTSDPDLNALHAEAIHTFLYVMEMAKADSTATYETYLWSMVAGYSDAIAVPADFITVADDVSPTSYTYYGSGGLSWATPYVAGMLALGLQVNPSATPQELFAAILESASLFGEQGIRGKIVNPSAFVEALR